MRTCILQTHSKVNEDLFQLTLPNHAAYCGRHEYDMVQINCSYKEFLLDLLDHIEKQLAIHDQVLSVGSDIIFTAPEIPLSAFDNGTHSVFMGEEGLGSSPVNFDLVLWTRRPGTFKIIDRLRELRPQYENHSWGLQAGVCILIAQREMQEHLCIYRARGMQSAPFPNQRGTWQPGDFSLHFVGMSNVNKYAGCKQFLETGTVRWLPGVGNNDG